MSNPESGELPRIPQGEGPIAWEDPTRSLLGRISGTLSSAFHPIRSLRAVSSGSVGPALRFALLSALPFTLLWAIIPFTESLVFGNLGITKNPEAHIGVALDVARAAGVGALLSITAWLAWAIPFASLLKAFAGAPIAAAIAPSAAWRLALYRAWLVPCGLTLFWAFFWTLPKEPPVAALRLADLVLQQIPHFLLLVHCQAMARFFGASLFGSILVAMVPVGVQWAVALNVAAVASRLLPHLANM